MDWDLGRAEIEDQNPFVPLNRTIDVDWSFSAELHSGEGRPTAEYQVRHTRVKV